MKNFIIKIFCLCIILGIFFMHNSVSAQRIEMEAQAKAAAEQAMAELSGQQDDSGEGPYTDGTYSGSAQGYGGTITVEVVIEDGYISTITPVSYSGEDDAYWQMCSGVIPQLIESQGTQADTVSGATFTSGGIINAVISALQQAM